MDVIISREIPRGTIIEMLEWALAHMAFPEDGFFWQGPRWRVPTAQDEIERLIHSLGLIPENEVRRHSACYRIADPEKAIWFKMKYQ